MGIRSLATREGAHPPYPDAASLLLGTELAELTRRELTVLTPSLQRLARVLPPDLFGRLADAVEVRVLYGAAEEPWPEIAELVDAGVAEMAREVSVPFPHVLVIRDRAVVYLPSNRHPMADRLMRVQNSVMARSLAAAADGIWAMARKARRFEVLEVPSAGEPDGEHRDVARVLGAGLTDDRAAARLNMSRRTFSRRVAMLMSRLDASSRFQAGVRAARRGWV